MAQHKISPINNKQENKSIKFDMVTDDLVRASARKGYEVAKIFKEAGLSFKRVVPAHSDIATKKLFKLGDTGPNLCLEVVIPGKTQEEKDQYINEIKDQFLMMPSFILVADKPYNSGRGQIIHKFLFRHSKSEIND